MFFFYVSIVFVIFGYLLYYYFTRTFKYWKSRNIAGPKPVPFFGNIKDFVLRKCNAATFIKQIYEDYPNEKVVGVYRMTTPCLIVRDLDIINNILIKDFHNFEDRGIQLAKQGLGANLFHADSEIWRPLRNRFSPIFTSSKLKNMIHLILERADIFIEYIKYNTKARREQEIYTLMQKFTILSISACAFGLDIDLDGPFLNRISKIDRLTFSRNIFQDIDLLYPGILKKLNSSFFPKELNDFFFDLIKDIMRMRNGVPSDRKDFMDLILELKNQGNVLENNNLEDTENAIVKITDEVLAAQAYVFYIAGYETTATTLAFMIYELAINPKVQEKLIAEIDEVLNRHNGHITYEIISEFSYMEQVFNETLRKYPIIDLQRRAKEDYKVPGTNITIEKGIIIFVPTYGINYDEKYYSEPTKFDPERFSHENVAERHHCAFIPFGTGPRNCIGKLFAKIQSRVCLIKLLSIFRVEPSENTQIPSFDPERVVIAPKGGIYLNLVPRKVAKLF